MTTRMAASIGLYRVMISSAAIAAVPLRRESVSQVLVQCQCIAFG